MIRVGKKVRKTTLEEVSRFFKNNNVKCIKIGCNNYLSDFDLGKIEQAGRPSPKYHFCIKCKGKRSSIEYIRCLFCNKTMFFTGQKIKCNDCRKDKIPYHLSEKRLEELITN